MSRPALHPLAKAANDVLAKDCPVVHDLLSERGKRFFFPAKGILAQGAEAKQKAKTANATVGIATENGAPMHLACISRYYQGLTPAEVFDYAPSYGKPGCAPRGRRSSVPRRRSSRTTRSRTRW